MNENQLTIVREDGTEEIVEILFTHEHDGNHYVVFQFTDSDEISAARYVADQDNEEEGVLEGIETDEEWDMLEKELEKFFDFLDEEEDEE